MPRAQKAKFKRSSAGVREFLTADPGVRTLMAQAGAAVASGARGFRDSAGTDVPVEVETGISTWPGHHDRQAAKVTLKHPAGVPLEAKYGILSSATVEAGLEWGRRTSKR